MTRPGRPPEQQERPPRLATGGPQQAVSILSDLNPGRVRLAGADGGRAGRWKWGLPLALLTLLGGGFLLGRHAPGPSPEAPRAVVPPAAGSHPAPVATAAPPPALPTTPGGGAIIRETPPPAEAGTPGAQAPQPPAARPAPQAAASAPRHAAPTRAAREQPAPPTTAPPAGLPAPGRAVERDVDIVTAIVR